MLWGTSMSPEFVLRDHVRAGLLLLVGAVIFVLSTPGLESLPQRPSTLEAEADAFPPALNTLARGAMWVELHGRRPLEEALTPLQRPLRLEQSWSLYGSGPRLARRMLVRIDGVLVHRTGDPEHAWLVRQLRHRRVRPMVETVVTKRAPANRAGLERFILTRALAAWPSAKRVTLQFTRTPYPQEEPEVYRVRSARAPEWVFSTSERGEGR